MNEAPAAIFLSYAREDTDAARRIADALRAFGLEVWFDQSELRGGDEWDAKLKKQIRECALFMPVVSANTQARREGYFRREWKQAVERTHDMAGGAPFLVPVVVDDTPETGALVPEEFLRVQWTRLVHGVPSPEFVGQVQRLLGSPAASSGSREAFGIRGKQSETLTRSATSKGLPTWAWVVALVVLVAAAVPLWKFFPGHAARPAGPPVIMLMDSTYPDRVYDPVTLKNGGSNADDITDLLRDLPVTIVKEGINAVWNREAEVVKEHPALIVIHRSGFYAFPASQSADLYPLADNKLVAFLGYVATLSPETKFIIYSRHSFEDQAVAAKWREDAVNRFPPLAGKLETWRVPLDRATFRNPLTAQELRASVERALGFKAGPAAQN